MMECPIAAKVFLDGREIASGEVLLREFPDRSVFLPQHQIERDSYLDQPTTLKLWNTDDEIPIVRFELCDASPIYKHWHFERPEPQPHSEIQEKA